MAHQRTVTKNTIYFLHNQGKKIHILYAYTGDQNQNGKRRVLEGGGLRSESGDFWRQHWQVKSLNLSPHNHIYPASHYCYLHLFWLLPLCHILIRHAQSPPVTQPMPLQAGHSAWLSLFSDWEPTTRWNNRENKTMKVKMSINCAFLGRYPWACMLICMHTV